jgi:hypothetical protein
MAERVPGLAASSARHRVIFPRQSATIAPMAHYKAGRNDRCPCGSGRKFKKCCESTQRQARTSRLLIAIVVAALAGAVYAGFAGFDEDTAGATARPGQVWSPEHGHYH